MLLARKLPILWFMNVSFYSYDRFPTFPTQCYSNEKSFKKKAIPPEASVDHMNMKHERNLKRNWTARKKKNIHWKTEQPQALTFTARTEEISNMTGSNAVGDMLEQFPYLENEKVARINIC